ncbi:MAG: 30S ribosome-binding factor RbfA [Caldilineaceae bacterium]|nr:30S ribosome-binding factor RbfA [Caldilineaceae bacterium]MCY3990705.1 30S ribosome-binding factor RbfA [Caldilineaceae bacterium]MDE0079281.1 30S ribosome-binding factor RbfA [Caldilineaceae bacterium]
MTTTIRQERAAELLYQELSILIGAELDDPALELLEVTNVVVSRDLRVAKVYIHQDSDIQSSVVLARLKKAAPFLRRQLAQSLTFRAVPELLFYYDDTPDQAARVDALLQSIAEEREIRQQDAGSSLSPVSPSLSSPDFSSIDAQKEDA